MPENTSMSESGIPAEAVHIPESGEETTAESATETKLNGTNPSHQGEEAKADNTDDEKKDVPFHEHPRWKEIHSQNKAFEKELKSTKSTLEQVVSQNEAMLAAFTALKEGKKDVELDPRFAAAVGNDDVAKEFFNYMREMISQEKDATKKQLLEEIQAEQQKAQQQVQQYQEMIDTEFEKMEADGLVFDREEVLKIAKEYETGGYLLDFRKAYKLLNEAKQARKEQESLSKKEKAGLVSSGASTTESSIDFDREAWKKSGSLSNWKRFKKN